MTLIRCVLGDIKKEKGVANVVVNAANAELFLGDGIAGALKKVCGTKLQTECDEFIKQMKAQLKFDRVPVGSMALTLVHPWQVPHPHHLVWLNMWTMRWSKIWTSVQI